MTIAEEQLIDYARNNKLKKLKSLLKRNSGDDFDINTTTRSGATALHIAARNNFLNVCAGLIKNGANVDTTDSYDVTPLHEAVYAGNYDVAKLLLEKGADVNLKDDENMSPLHHAALNNDLDMIELLVANGAKIDLRANDNKTPLLLAARENKIEAACKLIELGANVNIRDSEGKAALYHAAKHGIRTLTKTLLDNGAYTSTASNSGVTPLQRAAKDGAKAGPCFLLLEAGANFSNVKVSKGLFKGSVPILDVLYKLDETRTINALLKHLYIPTKYTDKSGNPVFLQSKEITTALSRFGTLVTKPNITIQKPQHLLHEMATVAPSNTPMAAGM